ncbi:MAG: 50S ribosomal protein L3 [Bacteroidota bacterium]
MKGIIGRKVGMTTSYNERGHSMACTVLQAGPCTVVALKTKEKDGYEAIQLGYEEKKVKNTTKPLQKHFQKANTTPKKKLAEFEFSQDHEGDVKMGDLVEVSNVFKEGDEIEVTGKSKGQGFAGVVKRHKFSGVGESTHGQKDRQRAPGSIGACSTPSRVLKGMKMAGRMGGERKTVKNLKIIKIIPEENLLIVKGPVPGPKKSYLLLNKK